MFVCLGTSMGMYMEQSPALMNMDDLARLQPG